MTAHCGFQSIKSLFYRQDSSSCDVCRGESTTKLPSHLLQQRHLLRLGIFTAAGDAVQVYAAGNTGAGDVGAVGCGRAVNVVLPHRLG